MDFYDDADLEAAREEDNRNYRSRLSRYAPDYSSAATQPPDVPDEPEQEDEDEDDADEDSSDDYLQDDFEDEDEDEDAPDDPQDKMQLTWEESSHPRMCEPPLESGGGAAARTHLG